MLFRSKISNEEALKRAIEKQAFVQEGMGAGGRGDYALRPQR